MYVHANILNILYLECVLYVCEQNSANIEKSPTGILKQRCGINLTTT